MAAPPPARPPQALMDEIVEEIILRLPPAEPASLVRAALVCKPWCGLIASPRFRRRFRAFHSTAPTLGVLCNVREGDDHCVVRFVPTSPVRRSPRADQRKSFTCDARHGRVLLSTMDARGDPALVVWNPMTNERWQLPSGPSLFYCWNVAVLCPAMGACDHIDCPNGAFLVVALITIPRSRKVAFWVYSSEAGTWRKKAYVVADVFSADLSPNALVGNTLYIPVNELKSIFSFEVESWKISVINAPPMSGHDATVVMSGSLITIADGGLGVTRLDRDARLSIWSMEVNPNGAKGWTKIRVIELVKLLSIDAHAICSDFVPFSPDDGIFFMGTNEGLFAIDLKSGLKKKVCEELRNNGRLDVFPYTTFYTPVLGAVCTGSRPSGASNSRPCGSALEPPAASAGEGPSTDASSSSASKA